MLFCINYHHFQWYSAGCNYVMQLGNFNEFYYDQKLKDGTTAKRGPFYNFTIKEKDGKTISKSVPKKALRKFAVKSRTTTGSKTHKWVHRGVRDIVSLDAWWWGYQKSLLNQTRKELMTYPKTVKKILPGDISAMAECPQNFSNNTGMYLHKASQWWLVLEYCISFQALNSILLTVDIGCSLEYVFMNFPF